MPTRPRHRRGLMLLDMIGGLLLIAAASSLLVNALGRQGRVSARLAEERAAIRRAEAVLASLAATPERPTTLPADLTVRALPDAAPSGWRWVTVSVPSGSHRAELTGLVHADAVRETR